MTRFMELRRALRARVQRTLHEQTGITLIELLVSMSIMMLVIGSLGTLFVSGSNAESELNRRYQAQQHARLALDLLRRDVHDACQATVTTGASTQSVALTVRVKQGETYPCTQASWTWCTIGSASRFVLYRQAGATCSAAGGARRADYLTAFNVFSSPAASAPVLPKLVVDLPVDLTPADASGAYRLQDAIAIRNVARS